MSWGWLPPPNWIEKPGVWLPPSYRPNEWEVPTPIVRTLDEATVEYARCKQSLPYFVFSHCWSLHTDDPGGEPAYHKFPTYPYLLDFFERMQVPRNVHLEKSASC